MKVRFVSMTQVDPQYLRETLVEAGEEFAEVLKDSEGLMAYIARVSSPNQTNPSYEKLLRHCMDHKHWSVFDMIDATVEITTSRAIAQQILRHRSFCFQEFSQRYAKAVGMERYSARRQDTKNRQNSIDDLSEADHRFWESAQDAVEIVCTEKYEAALARGIAKECARFLLPLQTQTKLYMKGSLRSWIHYLETRTDPASQKEHRDIALAIREVMSNRFPIVASAAGWTLP
jgi:thymidylate synthase (FAD)